MARDEAQYLIEVLTCVEANVRQFPEVFDRRSLERLQIVSLATLRLLQEVLPEGEVGMDDLATQKRGTDQFST